MSDQRASVRRRSVLRASVWSAPVVLTATAVPAFAASACVGFSSPTPTSATYTVTNTRTNGGGNGFTTGGYAVVGDPSSTDPTGATPASVVLTGPSPTFTLGRTYRFSFTFSGRSLNPRDLQFSIVLGGQTLADSVVSSAGRADPFSGTVTFDYTPATTAARQVVLRFDFLPAGSTVGDDITISSLAVVCRPAGT